MIAYNKKWLKHLFIQQEAEAAYREDAITHEEHEKIRQSFPSSFYSPDIFIRIGLFVLTFIIMVFSFILMGLMFMNSIESAVGTLAIVFGIFCYAALEYFVAVKKHYRSGVDEALLWGAAIALFSGVCLSYNLGNLTICLVAFVIALAGTLRFADKVMVASCYIFFTGILFFAFVNVGGALKALLPFIVMGVSLITYILVKKRADKPGFNVYKSCYLFIEIISLLTLYISGNYCVVRELSVNMLGLSLTPGGSIPFGTIFWIFTFIVPLVYLARGIQKKDVVLIRSGMILVAAIVFTVRFYYNAVPAETLMLAGGSFVLICAFIVSRYLAKPKHGFTLDDIKTDNSPGKLNAESLVVTETFSSIPTGGTQFGGGSFGGGGASGDF